MDEQRNSKIGELIRKRQESEANLATLDSQIKYYGDQLLLLGGKLKNAQIGGDYRDLLSFLDKAGVDTPRIAESLQHRNELSAEVAQCTMELAALGVHK